MQYMGIHAIHKYIHAIHGHACITWIHMYYMGAHVSQASQCMRAHALRDRRTIHAIPALAATRASFSLDTHAFL